MNTKELLPPYGSLVEKLPLLENGAPDKERFQGIVTDMVFSGTPAYVVAEITQLVIEARNARKVPMPGTIAFLCGLTCVFVSLIIGLTFDMFSNMQLAVTAVVGMTVLCMVIVWLTSKSNYQRTLSQHRKTIVRHYTQLSSTAKLELYRLDPTLTAWIRRAL